MDWCTPSRMSPIFFPLPSQESVHARQHQIQDHHVVRVRLDKREGLFPVTSQIDGETLFRERGGNRHRDAMFVFDNQYAHVDRPVV